VALHRPYLDISILRQRVWPFQPCSGIAANPLIEAALDRSNDGGSGNAGFSMACHSKPYLKRLSIKRKIETARIFFLVIHQPTRACRRPMFQKAMKCRSGGRCAHA